MIRIRDIPVSEDFLSYVLEEIQAGGRSVVTVFPGKRPVHFARRAYARKMGRVTESPDMVTQEIFLTRVAGLENQPALAEADAVYLVREAILARGPSTLRTLAEDLAQFYPWGVEFFRILDELDRENVSLDLLSSLKEWIPAETLREETRDYLDALPAIRSIFHTLLEDRNAATSGRIARMALQRLESAEAELPQKVIYAGPFALTGIERACLASMGKWSNVVILRHQDGRPWTAFERHHELLDHPPDVVTRAKLPSIQIHQAPNVHGELLALKNLLLQINPEEWERTAIVLPEPSSLLPLLWEVMTCLHVPYNITLGYPLTRTPLVTLFHQILDLLETERDGAFHLGSYLSVLFHPYVKNFHRGLQDSASMRILVHGIDEWVRSSGLIYATLEELGGREGIFQRASAMSGDKVGPAGLRDAFSYLQDLLIGRIRSVRTLREMGEAFSDLLEALAEFSPARFYPFFNEFFIEASRALEQLASLLIADEPLEDPHLLYQLLRHHLNSIRVPFTGQPLRGLQILGLLETRDLSFDTVYVLDVNTDILPSVSRFDPLLPSSLRGILGLPGSNDREEVMKYHFYRLVESSQNVHLFYRDNPSQSRSHFIEELVYEVEMREGRIGVVQPKPTMVPQLPDVCSPPAVTKTPELIERMKKMVFSASSLDSYLMCPMLFYYQKILGLQEREEITEELEALDVGERLHGIMEDLFLPHRGTLLTDPAFEEMKVNLPEKIRERFGSGGGSVLFRHLAELRLRDFLEAEQLRAGQDPPRLLAVEEKITEKIPAGKYIPMVTGRIDRMEERESGLVLIDYKSGKDLKRKYMPRTEVSRDGFERDAIRSRLGSFQFPLYVELIHQTRSLPYEHIQAEALSLRDIRNNPVPLFKPGVNREEFMEGVFRPSLEALLDQLFDPHLPFMPDPLDDRHCNRCPFTTLCRRQAWSGGEESDSSEPHSG
ncbi:MAG TPA: PD-(D/E)XK nuclease family protein [Thermoanaerobaculia bacterium]|nr:PD-(D/E)XK nuclease family protein [Thermoanaerobaculia bacterium]HUM30752.1 PD-(D/E)XK nuclease family protein [Thermoanaerobaculia bacterium]HXK68959.1 PD-(D/E)XK nuclease family protein [Thermoanaerobaculia bacterium]